jgi:hypothetical protein
VLGLAENRRGCVNSFVEDVGTLLAENSLVVIEF